MHFILRLIFFLDITSHYIEATYSHVQYDTHLSLDGRRPRIIKHTPSLSVLASFLFFILRLLSFVLTALWRFIGAVDDPRESLLRAPVNYPGVVIRRRAAGGGPSEILTLAGGRSGGVHGLSLVRGIRLIALTQLIP